MGARAGKNSMETNINTQYSNHVYTMLHISVHHGPSFIWNSILFKCKACCMLMSYAKQVSIISRNLQVTMCWNLSNNVLIFSHHFSEFLWDHRSSIYHIKQKLNQVSMENFLHTNILQKGESLHQERFVLSLGDMLEW